MISLNDDQWQFGQVTRRSVKANDVYDVTAVSEWLPATVPGNVRTDLLALGRISDPFVAENYRDSLWVEMVDWWYRRDIAGEPLSDTRRAFLIFEGIDYLSAIFVNGRELARHEGMFSRQVIEISEELRAGQGRAQVEVRVWGSSALPKRRLNRLQRGWQEIAEKLHPGWVGVYPDRSATLKFQMSFGWDFAPPIRTMGIWDEVWLAISGPVFMAGTKVTAQPLVSPSLQKNSGKPLEIQAPAECLIDLTVDSDRSRQVTALVRVKPPASAGSSFEPYLFQLHLPEGISQLRLSCHLPQAALWQPWDRGQPHLHTLLVRLTAPTGELLDEARLRTGIRKVQLDRWQFIINGQPAFIRGLNWVPADSFPGRLRRADYARLLTMARDGGANMIRVWGGGLREKRAFYDLCDELGLLVWQEFPFACMFLGSYPRDQAYMKLIQTECGAMVRQLSHHPCLAAWCGGNEFSRQRNRPLIKTLATLVDREGGHTPFIPISPHAAEGGDAHNWLVWHGFAPIRAYQSERARFMSEFGLQALPDLETLAAALADPNDQESWASHQADLAKLRRYIGPFLNLLAMADGSFPTPNLQALVSCSQEAQATALQTGIEHMRRRKGAAGGVCLWQFNEPWPAISWAIVDYFGRPKLAYQRLSDWYNLLLISLKFPVGQRRRAGDSFAAEIWAINDSLQAYLECGLHIWLDGQPIHQQIVDLPANSARQVGVVDHRLAAAPQQIEIRLKQGQRLLSKNRYNLGWWDEAGGPISQKMRRWLAGWVMW